MATMLARDKVTDNPKTAQKPPKRSAKKKSSSKPTRSEQNNNDNPQRSSAENKNDMLAAYQPWVIQTYGDLAKTKTITLKKYARILRTLRGEEIVSADNSKFRFWVKAKGFCVGRPAGYEAKPADGIVGRYSVCDSDEGIPPLDDKLMGSAKDPPLYVPNAPFKNSTGEPIYRKVAVVENFFDIIYNVHVDLEGRPGKHAGQKRTYRTITETYAFLPREAVTRFLLGCTECQKRPRSPSPPAAAVPAPLLPTPSPSPTLPTSVGGQQQAPIPPAIIPIQCQQAPPMVVSTATTCHVQQQDVEGVGCYGMANGGLNGFCHSPQPERTRTPPKREHPSKTDTPEPAKRSSNPLDVCNLTSRDPPRSPASKKRPHESSGPKLWSPVHHLDNGEPHEKRMLLGGDIDFSLPITTTYLKYMRSLGCRDEDAFKFENRHVSLVIERFLFEAITHYFH